MIIKTYTIISIITIMVSKSARNILLLSESVGNRKNNGKNSVQKRIIANITERNILFENNFISAVYLEFITYAPYGLQFPFFAFAELFSNAFYMYVYGSGIAFVIGAPNIG